MKSQPLTIWCNTRLEERPLAELRERTKGHRLIFPEGLQASNLAVGGPDPLLPDADIALGQPDPIQTLQMSRLKWVHLTTAGYTRYDRDDVRAAFKARGAVMTNSSAVYANPCAEQAFAMLLAYARRLPHCMDDQRGARTWHAAEHRAHCKTLGGETALVLGFGAIGRRLVELMQPLRMNITAVRRNPTGNEGCRVLSTDRVDELLPLADHVLNVLPATTETENFLDRRRIGLMKPAAVLYNVGRGNTVEQPALIEALQQKRLAAAYLDVTDPEPLPPSHALWSTPNCFITPHIAGGQPDEFQQLVRHFADNLDQFVAGGKLQDQII